MDLYTTGQRIDVGYDSRSHRAETLDIVPGQVFGGVDGDRVVTPSDIAKGRAGLGLIQTSGDHPLFDVRALWLRIPDTAAPIESGAWGGPGSVTLIESRMTLAVPGQVDNRVSTLKSDGKISGLWYEWGDGAETDSGGSHHYAVPGTYQITVTAHLTETAGFDLWIDPVTVLTVTTTEVPL